MGLIEPRKRKLGDRKDGHRVKNAPALNIIMSALYPNRCDCEVATTIETDVTDLLAYIEKKNAEKEGSNIKFFHCFVTALVRVVNERRKLNRFVQGARMYERDTITASFVAKRQFHDNAKETLITYKARKDDNLDAVSNFILGNVKEAKAEGAKTKKKSMDANVEGFAKTPRLLFILFIKFVRFLDLWGWVPKSLMRGDPAYSTVLISNLGSIKCPSCYHHLNNYGTCSLVFTIGTLRKKNVLNEDGSVSVRDVVDISVTADERIADGFYFAKSIKLLQEKLAHPEELERTFDDDDEIEE